MQINRNFGTRPSNFLFDEGFVWWMFYFQSHGGQCRPTGQLQSGKTVYSWYRICKGNFYTNANNKSLNIVFTQVNREPFLFKKNFPKVFLHKLNISDYNFFEDLLKHKKPSWHVSIPISKILKTNNKIFRMEFSAISLHPCSQVLWPPSPPCQSTLQRPGYKIRKWLMVIKLLF